MKCAICKTDLGKKGRNPGGCLCWKCWDGEKNPEGWTPADWQLCLVNNNKTWNGIMHKPTWTVFEIDGEVAKLIRTSELDPPSDKDLAVLATLAVKWFQSGDVSIHPMDEKETVEEKAERPVRVWAAQLCRPRQHAVP